MSQNFACFFGQFWIQNPIIVDSFKFSVPLSLAGALMSPPIYVFYGATTWGHHPTYTTPGATTWVILVGILQCVTQGIFFLDF